MTVMSMPSAFNAIRRFQRFEQRDARADDGDFVACLWRKLSRRRWGIVRRCRK